MLPRAPLAGTLPLLPLLLLPLALALAMPPLALLLPQRSVLALALQEVALPMPWICCQRAKACGGWQACGFACRVAAPRCARCRRWCGVS